MTAGPITPADDDDSAAARDDQAPKEESDQPRVPAQRTESEFEELKEQIGRELREQDPAIYARIARERLSAHSEEIAQRTRIKIFKARLRGTTYNPLDPSGKGFAWTAAGFECLEFRRNLAKDQHVFVSEIQETAQTGIPAADKELTEQTQLDAFITKYVPDERERTVYLLYHVEGYQIVEIAKILKIDRGTASKRLHRAEGRIRDAPKDDLM